MKISGKTILVTFLSGFLFGLFFISCQKDNVSRIVRHGNWEVTRFIEKDMDQTMLFKDYLFTFSRNGRVKAVGPGSSVIGTWSSGSDYSTSDFYLDFGSNVPFNEISEVWHVMESTGSIIRLQHISGGNGGTDLLTFEKYRL